MKKATDKNNTVKKSIIKKILISFSIFVLLCIVVFWSLVFYVDDQLALRQTHISFQDCHKIWTTRGLVKNGSLVPKEGNSIETIAAAFEAGAKGVEVDLYFDSTYGKFIISHDVPYNLKNGQLLTLEELFQAVGNGHFFWLDYKNLRKLNEVETQSAIARLDKITSALGIKDNIYIEGEDPFNLMRYREAGFNTIYDTRPLPENYGTVGFVINVYKMAYYFGNFTVMALETGTIESPIYGEQTSNLLSNVPLFLYHTPSEVEYLQGLVNQQQVKVIIVKDQRADRFGINSCELVL